MNGQQQFREIVAWLERGGRNEGDEREEIRENQQFPHFWVFVIPNE